MELPKPVPAANARSPNRRPRIRRVLSRYRTEMAQKLWLEHFGATGNFDQACIAVGRNMSCVRHWIAGDSDFCAKWRLIREAKRMMLQGRLEDMTEKALEVYQDTLNETQDKKLAFEAARRLLVSEGLLREGAGIQVAVQVNTEPPKYIEVRDAQVRDDNG